MHLPDWLTRPLRLPYVPEGQQPEPPQELFLRAPQLEVLFGGAAGPGKSWALLAAALMYVDVPGYAAILFRRTFQQLNQPGALISKSREWLAGTDAKYNGDQHRWTFPSGATLTFAYLDHDSHLDNYQGAEYQFIGFDELTQLPENRYRYLFSRCRRPSQGETELGNVPLRIRAASNPGGRGHDWVKRRFITEQHADRVFIPAKLAENPHIDRDAYVASLQHLPPALRQQLLDGDWDAREPGDYFRRDWFTVVDRYPRADCRMVRAWDIAATQPTANRPDPDYLVGALVGLHPNGTWYVAHVIRERVSPGGVKELIRQTALADGTDVTVAIEQEPGAGAKVFADDISRSLPGHAVYARTANAKKHLRARVVAAAAEQKRVHLVAGNWVTAWLDEHEAFGEDPSEYSHDDQVDATSLAFAELARARTVEPATYQPRGGSELVVRDGDVILRGAQYVDKPPRAAGRRR